MKFRFQIVASSFHKGRLKITYDPSYPLTNEYNTNYTYIIDLAKERDFTVEIGWGHEKSILNHRSPLQNSLPYGTAPLGSDPGNSGNGILSVYVVNDLTVPNSTANNDIEVNVFVSAGDDFEVYDPDSRYIEDLVWFEPQMSEVFTPQMADTGEQASHPDADLTKREDEPMKEEPSSTMAPTLSDRDHTSCVYYGDPVTSFRQCLKRYNYHSAVCLSGNVLGPVMLNLRNSNFPYYRGYAPGAVHETSVPFPATPYNYSKMTLLNYIAPAFTCRRGGLRWKYCRVGDNDMKSALMMVTRDASPGLGYRQDETALLPQGDGTLSDRVRQNSVLLPHTWDGSVATCTRQNPVIEAEIPYYSNVRFLPAKQADLTSTNGNFRQYHVLSMNWEAPDTDFAATHCFVSVGEDFNLGFFTGAPVAWRVPQESEPPA